VCLPSWANVEFFDMRIDDGASMLSYTPPVKPKYVALGDSITHGTGQQSYTHKTYAYQLSKLLDVDLYNLAVGGSRVSVPTGEMLSEFPPIDVITLLIGYNDCFGDVALTTYQSNLTAWVEACRTNQPDADIFCITPTYTDNVASNRTDGTGIEDFRIAVSNVVAAAQLAGDTNIYLIHGDQIITNSAQLIDGIHLLPDGATDMANGLFAEMDAIVNAPEDGITHAHDDPRFDYDGVLFPKHTNDYVQLNRFSDPVLADAFGFNVDRAIVPSCVVIRFTTASPSITAHFTTIPTDKDLKMPQYAVYRNGTTDISDYEEFKFVGGTTNPVFTFETETPGSNVMYEILLPSLNATAFQGLTLDSGYDLVTNAPYERPVHVAIGDSITMNAGFQSMSYETYTWKFARARGMEVYNIAVGGAVTAPDWGSMFPSLNPEFITVLFGINDWNTANDLTIYRDKYMELLDNIRADHPTAPLFCITLVAVNDTVNQIGSAGVTVDAYRREIIDMVNERRTAGDSNIYLIAGHSMTESEDLLDSFHFDRPGTTKFATNLSAAIDAILVDSNYTGVAEIPTSFSDWAAPYALNAAVTNYYADADLDGLNNLAEFALGGNPTNGLRTGRFPEIQSNGGVEYVYQRRKNASALGLVYTPQAVSNLTDTGWSTNGITETGSTSVDSDFESVSNRINLDGKGFVRLTIEEAP
jgi:lysophospholipase L1-like esterase